jgi:ATP-binding cassette, subfamily F, member 3
LDALNDYEGAVILITHDRSLMELVADRLWLADGGTIAPFDGDMSDYAKFVLDRVRRASTPDKTPPPKAAPAAPKGSASTLRHRLQAAEQALARATTVVAEIDRSLADPKTYGADAAKAADLARRREQAQSELEAAEAAWMQAAEDCEGVG